MSEQPEPAELERTRKERALAEIARIRAEFGWKRRPKDDDD